MGAPRKGFLTLAGIMLALEVVALVLVIRHGQWQTDHVIFVAYVALVTVVYIIFWVWSVLE